MKPYPLILLDQSTIFAIHNAIHDRQCTEVHLLDQISCQNRSVQVEHTAKGLRFITINGSVRFIEQNKNTDSSYAERAKKGERLTWVMTGVDKQWGLISSSNSAESRPKIEQYCAAFCFEISKEEEPDGSDSDDDDVVSVAASELDVDCDAEMLAADPRTPPPPAQLPTKTTRYSSKKRNLSQAFEQPIMVAQSPSKPHNIRLVMPPPSPLPKPSPASASAAKKRKALGVKEALDELKKMDCPDCIYDHVPLTRDPRFKTEIGDENAMSIARMHRKLNRTGYANVQEAEQDLIRLVNNSEKYFGADSVELRAAKALHARYRELTGLEDTGAAASAAASSSNDK